MFPLFWFGAKRRDIGLQGRGHMHGTERRLVTTYVPGEGIYATPKERYCGVR